MNESLKKPRRKKFEILESNENTTSQNLRARMKAVLRRKVSALHVYSKKSEGPQVRDWTSPLKDIERENHQTSNQYRKKTVRSGKKWVRGKQTTTKNQWSRSLNTASIDSASPEDVVHEVRILVPAVSYWSGRLPKQCRFLLLLLDHH